MELPEKYKMTALRCILVGDIKKHIDLREEEITTYTQLRDIVMKWAVVQKIEKDRGHAPMDVDEVEDKEKEEGEAEEEQGVEDWDTAYMGQRGKGWRGSMSLWSTS